MGERSNELPTPHLSFIALLITLDDVLSKTKQTNRKKNYQKEKKNYMNAPFINLT
jgi:hypothetical protein